MSRSVILSFRKPRSQFKLKSSKPRTITPVKCQFDTQSKECLSQKRNNPMKTEDLLCGL